MTLSFVFCCFFPTAPASACTVDGAFHWFQSVHFGLYAKKLIPRVIEHCYCAGMEEKT